MPRLAFVEHGKYTFVREIGRGASGAVWLARDTVLGRDVAIKRVGQAPDGGEPEQERADREARLAASLSHPHVVAVHDMYQADGFYWMVMEYVAGPTLSALVRETGPLPPDRAAHLIAQVAYALDAAHRAGFVHRDVKPSNVLVGPGDHALLTDFGIARGFEDASLTRTGLVTGSPAYLSPEVAQGRPATPASDAWALGATLYHLLAGHPPYEVADNLLGTMYRIVHEEPPRPPGAGWLAEVLEHTMATDPDVRWSMAEVRTVLARGPVAGSVSDALRPAAVRGSRRTDEETRERTAVVQVVDSLDGNENPATPPPRRHVLRWALAGAAVVAASVFAFTLGAQNGGDEPRGGPVAAPNTVPKPAPAVSGSPETVTEAELVDFVTDYLETVIAAPRVTWERLTPDFQVESNGFTSYRDFWSTIAEAEVLSVRADADTMTVSYQVRYTMQDGDRQRDRVTLRLVQEGDGLLISGEA